MRRWNGWGEEKTSYPLPESAEQYLKLAIGSGELIRDQSLVNALSKVPVSRLPEHPLISTHPEQRLYHTRGQSLPDWVALRYGRVDSYPGGVAFPCGDEDVRILIDYAQKMGVSLIPYGGGTSVVGHINPLPGDPATLTVDLSRLNKLEILDKTSLLATFGAGTCGPELESQLNQHGYTLGHYPQSFELSTLGGWIATRSSGQQSHYYGRIEDLFAGGHVETSLGPMDLPPLPASAAGPDLRQVILGSEGRFGILTRAIVRVHRIPEEDSFYGIFFHSWQEGIAAIREIAQEEIPISMARLINALETETTLKLSGKEKLVGWAERGLNLLNYPEGRVLFVVGVSGDHLSTHYARKRVRSIVRDYAGIFIGTSIGKIWKKSRFLTPYLRNTLWDKGYAVDTLETALPWSGIEPMAEAIVGAIRGSAQNFGEAVLVGVHLSHIYRDGASLYVTIIFRRTPDPDELLERWATMKDAASQVIIGQKGTISHQHGVGIDHAVYLAAEKGKIGIDLIRKTAEFIDPNGIFNPGKLVS